MIVMSAKLNPFEHNYFLGYVSQVFPQFIKVHFPSSVLLNGFVHFGQEFNGGLVGSFVTIEGDKYGFLGRITELSLPESERLSLSEKAFQTSDFHPTGRIEVLLSFDLYEPLKVRKGLTSHPNIGAKVFVSSGSLVQHYLLNFGSKDRKAKFGIATLGHLVSTPSIEVSINMQSIFGRHCAIVGTTGGGKSYTLSKLVESIASKDGKIILIDATGEYSGNYEGLETVNLGNGGAVFHYRQLTIDDLIFLLKPSERVQLPKLMEAIRSLKIVELNNGEDLVEGENKIEVKDGLLIKTNSSQRPYNAYYYRNISKIEDGYASFDINLLARQLREECVYSNGDKWENYHTNDIGFCISLMSRINNLINTSDYSDIFGFDREYKKEQDLTNRINEFHSSNKKVLRLNFENVKFDFRVRELLANAIGKFLLNKARKREFIQSPIIVALDEAHQFLNKSIEDEYFGAKPLDAYDSIAKECRKLGLFLCIATQMPRDIPQSTLSQMGTFIAHRLINHRDKEAIANACSAANNNTLDFLPILGEGEAIIIGVDFPMPIIMKLNEPECKPDSGTPPIFKESNS